MDEPERGQTGEREPGADGGRGAAGILAVFLLFLGTMIATVVLEQDVGAALQFTVACIGSLVAVAGALGTVLAVSRSASLGRLLRSVVVLAAGGALFMQDGWALVGLALAAAVLVAHDRLAPRTPDA